ncbi:hypothetical protein BJV78DRAFT_1228765, partial [Lactifluus subvellereus]
MGCNTDVLFHRYRKIIVNYLRIIHCILAPRGVWLNLGMAWMPGASVSHVPPRFI